VPPLPPRPRPGSRTTGRLSCGTNGLPRSDSFDGRFSHAGDFLIPGLLFLYIAGTIGWGRPRLLMAIRQVARMPPCVKSRSTLPWRKSTLAAAVWPLAAFNESSVGKMMKPDSKVDRLPPLIPLTWKKFLTTARSWAAGSGSPSQPAHDRDFSASSPI